MPQLDPNVFWGNVPEKASGQSPSMKAMSGGSYIQKRQGKMGMDPSARHPQITEAGRRTRELAAKHRADKQAAFEGVRNKFLQNGYAVGLGTHRDGPVLTLQDLQKAGLDLPNEIPRNGLAALPVGIDPRMLSARELDALGLPVDISMVEDDSHHEMPAIEITVPRRNR